MLWQALGLASGLAAVRHADRPGHVGQHHRRGALRAAGGALLRTGEVFRLTGMFGAQGGLPTVIVALRLTCLAAGLVLLASLCTVIAASAAALHAEAAAARPARARCSPTVTRRCRAHRHRLSERGRVLRLPGLRSQIVVGVGTLGAPAAANWRPSSPASEPTCAGAHDLVLLPFTALRRAFPGPPPARRPPFGGAAGRDARRRPRAAKQADARRVRLVRFGTHRCLPGARRRWPPGKARYSPGSVWLLQPVRRIPPPRSWPSAWRPPCWSPRRSRCSSSEV